jgi:hypothetical protein
MRIDRVSRRVSALVREQAPTLLAWCAALLCASPLRAQDAQLPPVTVGAGAQTSFVHNDPEKGDAIDSFPLNSVRLYVSGSAAKKVKFMFNTEYESKSDHLAVLDAAAQFEISDKLNIWMGQLIAPSDRANLYGPYYSNQWAPYNDGVQDGYPSVGVPGCCTGRDRGVLYWGQFDKVKVSGGVFDGATATGTSTVLSAGRVQVDFWDPEAGYYLNGTYYGAKNLLAIGVAGEVQGSDKSAWNADFLLEKKVPGGGAFTLESEYAKYSKLGGYKGNYAEDEGGYGLASYLFPPMMGVTGRFQVLGKYAKATYSKGLTALNPKYDQKTTEVNFNYIIKDFNARVMFFFRDQRFSAVESNNKQFGVGLQLQM